MANSASHASLPYPIKNARYTIQIPYLDADGDPTDPTTPDTEISGDGGSFADCAEEVTTFTGSNGVGHITLTGAETNYSEVALAAKVASGPKATLATLYPRVLAVVGSGTLSAGSAGGGTLGTLLAYDVTGCFIRTTGGTGGGGTGGANNQARKIITYNTGTGAFTVAPNWETTPSTDTTYDVLLPEGVTLGMLRTLNPTTAGRTLDIQATGEADVNLTLIGGSSVSTSSAQLGVNVVNYNGQTAATSNGYPDINVLQVLGVSANSSVSGNLDVNVTHAAGTAWGSGAITAAAFAAGAIDAAAIGTGAIDADSLATDAVTEIRDSVVAIFTDDVGTAQAGAAGTITLQSGAVATDDYYNGAIVTITGGTGAGQSRQITDYVGSTKVATVESNWVTNPDATSTYIVLGRVV